jgi:hypothetical protein
MTLLDTIPNTNTDCRKYKKDYGSDKDNARDWDDWLYNNAIPYKFQNIIRKKYLYNYYPVQVRDLELALRRDYLLGWDKIHLIVKHLIENNKFVEVDKLGQENFLAYHLYLLPRFPVNVKVSFCLLDTSYYDELKKFKDTHNKDLQQ